MRRGGLYLALGDSITWTQVTKGADLYAHRVRDAIQANHGPIRLLNKGIGGTVSTELVTGLPWSSRMEADIVTIGVGMNDCANQGVSVAAYKANLETLVDALRRRNPRVEIILCTPGRTTDANRAPYIADYRTAMAEVAAGKGTRICRFEDAWLAAEDATYLADGVHPNSAGHGKLFDVLWPVVQQIPLLGVLGDM